MIICQGCGTHNSEGASFCSKCARKLDAETQRVVIERRAAHTAAGLNLSAVIATIIMLVVAAVLLVLLITHVL